MSPSPVTLPGGSSVLLRPIRADDKAGLAAAHRRLSERSQYRRFMCPHPELTPDELRYFTEIDHATHEAIIALDPASGDLIGVARYIGGAPGEPAELAVMVVDAWQNRGVGTALVEALRARARANGVSCLLAEVLTTNRPMVALLHELGHERCVRRGGGVSEFAIAL